MSDQKPKKLDALEPILDEVKPKASSSPKPPAKPKAASFDALEPIEEAVAKAKPKPKPAPKPVAKAQPKPVAKAKPKPVAKSAASAPKVAKAADLTPITDDVSAKPAAAAAKPAAAAAKPVAPVRSSRSGGSGAKKEKKEKKPEPLAAKPGTQVRELEQAPKLLHKAAMILVAASLFPWMHLYPSAADPDVKIHVDLHLAYIAKALVVIGAWIFYQSLKASYGDNCPGFAKSLDKIKIIPAKGRSMGWNLGELLGLIVLCVGLFPVVDKSCYPDSAALSLYGDKAMLALASLTLAHIYAYSKGANFNPIFPLLFLGPAIAGVTSIPKTGVNWWTIGAVLTSVAGVLAVYTIGVALKQAKQEGDAKREAALEARRKSRKR